MTSIDKQKCVLIIVENLPVPYDRRVWQEATTLRKNGYRVSVICPKSKGLLNGTNGFLANPVDTEALHSTIVKLCNDSELRESMGEKSLELINAKFHMKNII